MKTNGLQLTTLAYRIKIRIRDFIDTLQNEGINSAIKKTLKFIYRRITTRGNRGSNNQLRHVIIFASHPRELINQIKLENQSPNRLFIKEINALLTINPNKVDINRNYIIFCVNSEYIYKSFEIRSQCWRNKLITTSEALAGTSTIEHMLYVDHVVSKDHKQNGFLGDLEANFDKYYEFYTSLWGQKRKNFGLLNLLNEPRKSIEKIRSDNSIYSIHIEYNSKELELASCHTFEQIIDQCQFQVSKVSEDIFWQFNKYTQSEVRDSKQLLKEALAKGAFVKVELL